MCQIVTVCTMCWTGRGLVPRPCSGTTRRATSTLPAPLSTAGTSMFLLETFLETPPSTGLTCSMPGISARPTLSSGPAQQTGLTLVVRRLMTTDCSLRWRMAAVWSSTTRVCTAMFVLSWTLMLWLSILFSSHMLCMTLKEQQGLLSGTGGGLASYDETALAAPAFRVLRTMVGSWLRDVSMFKNIYADYQIVHFYRWLRNPSSLLYDPALRKTLLQLMKKLFLQLVAEFKRLGAIVVYADFNKIILNTKKRTVSDAVSYVKYVTDNIKNKEIFHSIEMGMGGVWDVLMWCDPANYGGINSDLKQLEEAEETLADEDEDDAPPEVNMTWNMAAYLPDAGNIQGNFNRVVVGYISAMHNYLTEELERVAPGATPIRKRRISQTPSRSQKPNGETQTVDEFCAELVGGELSQRLFGVVDKINKKFPMIKGTDEDEDNIFPELPGSHLKLTFPALEFVKAVCKVLGLDPAVQNQVRKMRRNLLKLINVGEFDNVADWQDPCISFTLAEVICKTCNHCRDIDLCKDPHKGEKEGKPA